MQEISNTVNWQRNYKTKEEAVEAIFEGLSNCPGCAGLDGTFSILYADNFITIKPKKKKTSYETN